MDETNPKMTKAFAMVGLICGRFRDCPDDKTIAAVATADGGVERLTYGHVRNLLSSACRAGNRLQDITAIHCRETGPMGMVGDYCVECGHRWPCETRRVAYGERDDD